MPRLPNAVDVDKLLALRAEGMSIGRLAQQFGIGKIRIREVLGQHGIHSNAHRPGQEVIIRPSGSSSQQPCSICGRKGHPQDMKCRMCWIVMHPEWEQPGPWWANDKQCRDCMQRAVPDGQ